MNYYFAKYPVLRIFGKIIIVFLLILYLPILVATICLTAIIRLFNKRLSISIASTMPLILWSLFHVIFKLTFDISIPVLLNRNVIIISNHLFSGDFMFINALNTHRFKDAKYAIKSSLIYFPIFYQGCILCNFLSIKRYYESDKDRIVSYFKDMNNLQIPCWFVLFPEGHRFTRERMVESQVFAKNKGKPQLYNVLTPRVKGFSLVAKAVDPNYIDTVIDFTMHCCGPIPTFMKVMFSGEVYKYYCDARIVNLKEIEDAEVFLEEAFLRKDKLIQNWKDTNKDFDDSNKRL